LKRFVKKNKEDHVNFLRMGRFGGTFLKRNLILTILTILLALSPLMAEASEDQLSLPTSERIYGETLFASAYRMAIKGQVRESLSILDEALRWDPYLVSYYLMKGYCMYLLGDYEQAKSNIEAYLEVKSNDPFAKGFLQELDEKIRFLETSFSAGIESHAYAENSSGLMKESGLELFDTVFLRMPVRPAKKGNMLAFGDSLTEKIYIYRYSEGQWGKYFSGDVAGKIIRVIPIEKDQVLLVFSNGKISRAHIIDEHLDIIDEYKNHEASSVSDAVLAASKQLLVSDRIMGQVSLVNLENKTTVYSWKPGEANFEPVSIACIGTLAAVADRQGKRLFIIDIVKGKEKQVFSINGNPRSVEWLSSEKAVVLTENGDLYEISMKDRSCKKFAHTFSEAWFLFKDKGRGIVVTDTRFYRSICIKAEVDKGFLAMKISQPGKRTGRKKGLLEIRSRIITPLDSRERGERIFQGILSNNLVDVKIGNKILDGKLSELYADAGIKSLESLPSSTAQLVIDSASLPDNLESLKNIAGFAISNGIVIHVLVKNGFPELYHVRLAEITGGRIIFSRNDILAISQTPSYSLRINKNSQLELPGSPNAGGLFVTGRDGKTKIKGRIPFWNAFLDL